MSDTTNIEPQGSPLALWRVLTYASAGLEYCHWCDRDDVPDPRFDALMAVYIVSPAAKYDRIKACLITAEGVRFGPPAEPVCDTRVTLVLRC